MADDDRPRAPVGQKVDHRPAAVPVEIIGRLVQKDEIRLREDEGGKCGPRALPARKRRQQCFGPRIQPDAGESPGDPCFQRPVGKGQFLDAGRAGFRAVEQGQPVIRAKQVRDRLLRPQLNDLAQDAQGTIDGYPAGMRAADRRKSA